jgi:pimeloyl-ACP methyl ester carboxylesterase
MPEALVALESDPVVHVETGGWLVFQPVQTTPDTGLILYPGGRVDYRSYAPAARAIAAQGYLVVVPRMPLNLAVFSPNAARAVIQAYPEILTWVVGGHSLGGAMIANFAANDPTGIDGLIFWAAYPADSDDLSISDIQVASIYATQDGLSSVEEVLASQPRLPPETQWLSIEGGNHAQFGWYGEQPGDNAASISREEQQKQIIDASLDLLDKVSNRTSTD